MLPTIVASSPPGRGAGVGWFMESLHAFPNAHRDHEPVRETLTLSLSHRMGEGGRRTQEGPFMESPHDLKGAYRKHAPGGADLQVRPTQR